MFTKVSIIIYFIFFPTTHQHARHSDCTIWYESDKIPFQQASANNGIVQVHANSQTQAAAQLCNNTLNSTHYVLQYILTHSIESYYTVTIVLNLLNPTLENCQVCFQRCVAKVLLFKIISVNTSDCNFCESHCQAKNYQHHTNILTWKLNDWSAPNTCLEFVV